MNENCFVAGALAAKAIDAFSMGEPFPSQAEMSGYGRVLFMRGNIGPTTCPVSWWCGRT